MPKAFTTFAPLRVQRNSMQRSLACVLLTSAGWMSSSVQAANMDYARAAQANSENFVYETDAGAEAVAEPALAPVRRAHSTLYSQRLVEATRKGDLGQVKWLLNNGADPEYNGDGAGLSPMYMATKAGWVELADLFYQAGGDFTRPSANGTTYLHIAAANNRLEMVKFLVQIGVDANARTNKNWTPLHHAARFGSDQVVNYLLSQGADPNIYNSDGFSPRGLAVHLHHYQAAYELQGTTRVAERVESRQPVATRSNPQPAAQARPRRNLLSLFSFRR